MSYKEMGRYLKNVSIIVTNYYQSNVKQKGWHIIWLQTAQKFQITIDMRFGSHQVQNQFKRQAA